MQNTHKRQGVRGKRVTLNDVYPSDLLTDMDLKMCSLATKGAWVYGTLLYLWREGRDRVTATHAELAKLWDCTEEEALDVVLELGERDVAEITYDGVTVSIVSRRLSRQMKEREKARQRKAKQRAGTDPEGDVTPRVPPENALPSSSSSSSSSSSKKEILSTASSLAEHLIARAEAAYGRKMVTTTRATAPHIAKLIRVGIDETTIRAAIDWVTSPANIDRGQYAIQIHSGRALADKWDRVIAAMHRDNPRQPKPAVVLTNRTEIDYAEKLRQFERLPLRLDSDRRRIYAQIKNDIGPEGLARVLAASKRQPTQQEEKP